MARINQDARVFVAELAKGDEIAYPLGSQRHAWMHVIRGAVTLNGNTLYTGDAAAVDSEEKLALTGLNAEPERDSAVRSRLKRWYNCMQKPVILTVDDDPDVLRAIERDLKKHYEETYRVLRADSGTAALDLLRRLQRRNETVALLLVDHRMPQMNGVEMLQEAIKLYPNAKRTLLTAYADTDAAIKAINDVHLHHYLLKPWDPPEQQLFPVLDDLLNDWYADFHPPFEGIRVLGTRWSSQVLRHPQFPGAQSGAVSVAGCRRSRPRPGSRACS